MSAGPAGGGRTALGAGRLVSWVQLSSSSDEVRSRMIGLYFGLTSACTAVGGVLLGQLFDKQVLGWTPASAGGVLAAFGTWRLARHRALAGVRPPIAEAGREAG